MSITAEIEALSNEQLIAESRGIFRTPHHYVLANRLLDALNESERMKGLVAAHREENLALKKILEDVYWDDGLSAISDSTIERIRSAIKDQIEKDWSDGTRT